MIRKSFRPNSSEAIRKEAEDLINEKHYQGYRLINVDFDVADNAGHGKEQELKFENVKLATRSYK